MISEQKKKATLIIIILIITIGLLIQAIFYFKEKVNIIEEKKAFCFKQGDYVINKNMDVNCMFAYHETPTDIVLIEYYVSRVTSELWAEASPTFELGDYCFSCWSSFDCRSKHNDILRERGVHC